MDLALRNRTSEEYPDGIFHPQRRPSLSFIPRLKDELTEVKRYLLMNLMTSKRIMT